MKKLINDPRRLVRELLEGTVDLSPRLALLDGEDVVIRAELPAPAERKVAIISGGGSGHEPAHAGYVGRGMLTAAVAGDVFTSPSTDAVLAAILAVSGPAGAVLVVKNYTGDRLNFGLAAELARQQGIPVEVVVVADDVALRDLVARDRRRGIAGTVLVHKLAGAAAERGLPLADVAGIARSAAAALGSMGVALGACTVPSVGKPGFELGENEIEFGLGIHGEKGVERSTMLGADEIVASLLDSIVADLELKPGAKVALMVNGLGSTPPMELAVVSRAALANLRGRGIAVERAWTGNFMTAIEMPGVSLTVLPLDEQRNGLFDDATDVPVWPGDGRIAERKLVKVPPQPVPAKASPGPLSPRLKQVALAVAEALEASEQMLGDLDAKSGDGDLGASMVRGANAIRALGDDSFSSPARLLSDLGNALRRAIAGSSGPFYATALLRAAAVLAEKAEPTQQDWQAAFEAGTAAIMELGGAKPGDRTMVDALAPAADAWKKSGSFADAAKAADAGAKATSDMLPALGRASYLGKRALGHPDGGATAVAIWLGAIGANIPG
ncbi:dihydroxyacetone kinase family protein [Mesorhizobium sp. YM1C-6-2]|uniref:dihydroxyacetone kinase family protein n=1 Tax=Mesorhizobium sp. YM1C-6-2 TaxID=1827501 RepID=UPI000EF206A6|nr:dihydroxyacetone kinase family protein [Mesorhizobium sp. YM1C-6-2]RLP27097.1 dihydroxyacetone kinase subunit DhaK [Mesorhizobium sp. YM1C-6-2]